jgi:hypothetical protein
VACAPIACPLLAALPGVGVGFCVARLLYGTTEQSTYRISVAYGYLCLLPCTIWFDFFFD